MTFTRVLNPVICILSLLLSPFGSAGTQGVEIRQHQLWLDGVAQPQMWGAELQYFRLRGGPSPNVSRAQVLYDWDAALDRMVEAKMNIVTFYIPWDFHEYAPGKFDFTGTVDEDGDGNADYPSRDIHTFFRMIEEHGIRTIMARPGPYINAEWGFLGFGAIPKWFHDTYPNSHMLDSRGRRTKLYDYHNADLLRHTEVWFKTLDDEVLSKYRGPGRPIRFLQVDNETNLMWQWAYANDYSASAQARYRRFLKSEYASLEALNAAQGTSVATWDDVLAPVQAGKNLAQDQDWYRFHDRSMFEYLAKVRAMWERIGVREPEVIFTLAESYNAPPWGILPNYKLRNAPGQTGMMTVNLYPRTYNSWRPSLFNQPFKADHDVKAADAANDFYFGTVGEGAQQWSLGTEIQTGWWRGIEVSPEARAQTYLTVIGHGLKAVILYYFSEGYNWGWSWQKEQVQPHFDHLIKAQGLEGVAVENLPETFWDELSRTVDNEVILGIDVRGRMKESGEHASELYFDAPVDAHGAAREPFHLVKKIGENIVAPYGKFLAQSVRVASPVAIIKDTRAHAPNALTGKDSVRMNSDFEAGLVGAFLNVGINPEILHVGVQPRSDFLKQKLLVMHDNENLNSKITPVLKSFLNQGGHLVTIFGTKVAASLGLTVKRDQVFKHFGSSEVGFWINEQNNFSYELPVFCQPIIQHAEYTFAMRCPLEGGTITLIGVPFHEGFNSDDYGFDGDHQARQALVEQLLKNSNIEKDFEMTDEHGNPITQVSVFARALQGKSSPLWVTIKNGLKKSQRIFLKPRQGLIPNAIKLRVKHPLSAASEEISPDKLRTTGLQIYLPPYASEAFLFSD